jgi:hypothetical protein
VQSAVYLYASGAEATRRFARVSSADTATCLGRLLREGLVMTGRPQGLSVGPVDARTVYTDPLGDERAASRLTVPVSGSGVSVTAVVDLVSVRVGRGIAISLFGGAVSPVNSEFEAKLVGTVVERLSTGVTHAPPAD